MGVAALQCCRDGYSRKVLGLEIGNMRHKLMRMLERKLVMIAPDGQDSSRVSCMTMSHGCSLAKTPF